MLDREKIVPQPVAKRSVTCREILPYVQSGDFLMLRSESFAARFLQQASRAASPHPHLVYSPPLK